MQPTRDRHTQWELVHVRAFGVVLSSKFFMQHILPKAQYSKYKHDESGWDKKTDGKKCQRCYILKKWPTMHICIDREETILRYM